jgi:hypothetical protein
MLFATYLYETIPPQDLQRYKNEAISKFGRLTIQRAEGFLNKLTKEFLARLKSNHDATLSELVKVSHLDPTSDIVQRLIETHFNSIRQFWGTVCTVSIHIDGYKDLADKYGNDPRFSWIDETYHPEFGAFMQKAMIFYCKRLSKK